MTRDIVLDLVTENAVLHSGVLFFLFCLILFSYILHRGKSRQSHVLYQTIAAVVGYIAIVFVDVFDLAGQAVNSSLAGVISIAIFLVVPASILIDLLVLFSKRGEIQDE